MPTSLTFSRGAVWAAPIRKMLVVNNKLGLAFCLSSQDLSNTSQPLVYRTLGVGKPEKADKNGGPRGWTQLSKLIWLWLSKPFWDPILG